MTTTNTPDRIFEKLDRRFRAASKRANSTEAYRAEERAGDAFSDAELSLPGSTEHIAALRKIRHRIERFERIVGIR